MSLTVRAVLLTPSGLAFFPSTGLFLGRQAYLCETITRVEASSACLGTICSLFENGVLLQEISGSHIRSDDQVIVFQSLSLGEQSLYGAFVCILLSLS